jgi:thiol-disulfide isomerase/thioredoxin
MLEKINKIIIPLSIIAVGIIIAAAFVFVNQEKIKGAALKELSTQQAAEKAINYVNENLLGQGIVASLVDVSDTGSIYKIRLKIGETEYDSYVTKDGKLLFTEQGIDLDKEQNNSEEIVKQKGTTIGNFSISEDEICKENEKPIVYFFGSESCPHCLWEHPIFEKVANNFEGYISFYNNMDSDKDTEVLMKYSTGGIPTLVLGCKYYRVGSGEQAGEETESENLTALFCKLTGEKPGDICEPVKDLINQINE